MTISNKTVGALALMVCLAGCVSNTPQLDRSFGFAAKDTLRLQIVRPTPPGSQTAPALDGQAAKSAYDNYQKSFKDPVPQAGALTVGVGR